MMAIDHIINTKRYLLTTRNCLVLLIWWMMINYDYDAWRRRRPCSRNSNNNHTLLPTVVSVVLVSSQLAFYASPAGLFYCCVRCSRLLHGSHAASYLLTSFLYPPIQPTSSSNNNNSKKHTLPVTLSLLNRPRLSAGQPHLRSITFASIERQNCTTAPSPHASPLDPYYRACLPTQKILRLGRAAIRTPWCGSCGATAICVTAVRRERI